MGHCSSAPSESGLIRHQVISPQHPEETPAHTAASAMNERSHKTDFNHYLEVNNSAVKIVKEKFEHFDDLLKDFCELETFNEQLRKENESLRQRLVEKILSFEETFEKSIKRNWP